MNITITVALSNNKTLISDTIDTEAEATRINVSHNTVVREMAKVVDAYEKVGSLDTLMITRGGNPVGVNPAHVLWIEVHGWNAKVAEAAQAEVETRNVTRNRRSY